jgi:hypothetical protein
VAGDEGCAATVAVLDDLHQTAVPVGGEPIRSPVVEDQQVGATGTNEEDMDESKVARGKKRLGQGQTCSLNRDTRARSKWC